MRPIGPASVRLAPQNDPRSAQSKITKAQGAGLNLLAVDIWVPGVWGWVLGMYGGLPQN